jgi:membrane-associated HD superfamily phosphohydrolase
LATGNIYIYTNIVSEVAEWATSKALSNQVLVRVHPLNKYTHLCVCVCVCVCVIVYVCERERVRERARERECVCMYACNMYNIHIQARRFRMMSWCAYQLLYSYIFIYMYIYIYIVHEQRLKSRQDYVC